ncbi:hypothetical protein Cgig2_009085 [Carnegiea gigantea]|uniref:Uncharacterized protein n=1 Tax=Carnegiea gigantea TaxID=171969 RepID=A0A9Q1KEK7_9CARY|nr:hypothetical protein Cgig2_009085 [Carnegiea gigantea]
MKMKKEDQVRGPRLVQTTGDSNNVHHNNIVSNKVLPMSDSASSSSSSLTSSSLCIRRNVDDQQQCGPSDQIKKGKTNGESSNNNNKNKTLARMKELLRWAAAVKSGKAGKIGRKGLHFRNRSATIKSGAFGDNDSPKISLKWDVDSCSTTCSAVSAPPSLKHDQYAHKRGSWITTDDEFVVLEL